MHIFMSQKDTKLQINLIFFVVSDPPFNGHSDHSSTLQCMCHYSNVIMGAMASQITSLTIAYSTVYSSADQRKHQSSASLAFERRIHRWPVNSPHKRPVTRWWHHHENLNKCYPRFFFCFGGKRTTGRLEDILITNSPWQLPSEVPHAVDYTNVEHQMLM